MGVQSPKKTNFLKQLFNRNGNVNESVNNIENYEDGDHAKILNYYASFAENHPDLILVFSSEGELVSQNSGNINKLLGYSANIKLKFNKLLTEHTYSVLAAAFRNALIGNSEKHEVELKKKNGDAIYFLVTFIPITPENGVEGVYLILEDITEQKNLRQQIEIKAKYLNHAQHIAEIGSWEYTIDDDRLYCSDYFYHIFGFDRKEKLSMDIPFELVHPDDIEKTYSKLKQAYKGEGYFSEFRIYHGKTGELKYIQVQADVIWENKKPYKLIGVVRDNTKQKQLEAKLIQMNNNLHHILDHLSSGFWMKDYKTGQASYLSKGLEEILQVSRDSIYDNPSSWQEMIHPEQYEEVMENQKLLEKGESIKHRYRIQAGDGTTKWVYDQTIPWFNEEGELDKLFGVMADITSEVEMHDRLKYLAMNDSITGLPNQECLYEKLDEICKSNRPFALLYIDLDRFNVVNDSLGHHIGDEVLKKVADRLISLMSKKGYIARLGSNDFVVVIDEFSNKEEISSLVELISNSIEEPMTIIEYELFVTASVGISLFPEDGDNKLTLLENAHSALYYAKEQGKNNYQFYSNSRDVSSYKKYILEKDMRKAIVNEEFELYYQPQVEPHDGGIKGAEALIRWNHAEWGLVSPGEFIPLAEESHLIHYISDWVIRKVCVQLREWKDNGFALIPISINISPIRFMKSGLVELVKEQLELYQIPANYLEFEITEGTLLKSDKQVLSILGQLREIGIKIVIDDFGTGYASLDYLRSFDAAKIKIDQIFVQDVDKNKRNAAVVSAMLHLSKGLDIEIVAEGVEEMDQLTFLKQKECDLIQGYLFSKPVPLEKFEQILKTGYLKPKVRREKSEPIEERRNYYRFKFSNYVLGEMTVIQVGGKKVNLGSTSMLMEDVSLGGIKLISSLKLPVHSNMSFKFRFKLMNDIFEIEGTIQWKEEAKRGVFYYGIEFAINQEDETKLVGVINQMSVLRRLNQHIPDTDFIYEDPFVFLTNRK